MNRQQNDDMLNTNIQSLQDKKKVIRSKLCSSALLLNYPLQIYSSTTLNHAVYLQILAYLQQYVNGRGPNSGQASAFDITIMYVVSHTTPLIKQCLAENKYQCYNSNVLSSFGHKQLSWF
jgi:hypothetical protein